MNTKGYVVLLQRLYHTLNYGGSAPRWKLPLQQHFPQSVRLHHVLRMANQTAACRLHMQDLAHALSTTIPSIACHGDTMVHPSHRPGQEPACVAEACCYARFNAGL